MKIILAAPRGFCAGVDRAIQIVERAINKYGAPVYVRHEIVHNRHVVERLKKLGAIFVEELDQCPDDRPVVFSAHGVPKSVPKEANSRNMIYLDATCPLVSKVHVEAERHFAAGRQIVLIGHAGHPEVVGTMGQLPQGAVILVETKKDARTLQVSDESNMAFVTQTTLSVDDTKGIVDILKERFTNIVEPHKEDICYATTNRQAAVKAMAGQCDLVLVIGATSSSNSMRLVEVARKSGAKVAKLIESKEDLDWTELEGVEVLGLTAGASAPEDLMQDLLNAITKRIEVEVVPLQTAKENISFKLPQILQA
ncbi:MAG: 4-hydroxy-3-methylbut-2-enyl diphosphate reductase [Robiginitomaculum sp.]|nr:MAG: 4-hydroxy-3-methylbut-2-enyl diphosphate reductase [Robiginitomaculum sp.]